MDLLDEIDELLQLAPGECAPVAVPTTKTRRRGRPVTTPEWERPIRDMSPRQLARNGLIEVAQNYDAIVARTRADSLNSGRQMQIVQSRISAEKNERALRIVNIAQILKDPANDGWAWHPNCKVALRLAERDAFSKVSTDTLRKDIAKAKKLNWHAIHSD
jgi:hypothetical protein